MVFVFLRHTNRTTIMKKILLLILATMALTGCEKAVFDPAATPETEANLTLKLSCYERMPFSSRSVTDIADCCSRINVAIFSGDTKVRTVAQKHDDNGFGTIPLALEAGTYQLVVIAHNCDGTATITSAEKVTFPNNHVTDTFYYYGDITVGEEAQTVSLTLTRPVAAFELVLTEPLPANVKTLRFYYTGGSSTFSPASGYGCVNSRQTETRAAAGESTFKVLTFPHEAQDKLKIVVTALDAGGESVGETTFEDVPVAPDERTRYTGSIFSSAETHSAGIRLQAETDWAATHEYTF